MTTDAERLLALKRENLARMKVAGLPDGYLAGFVERQRGLVLGLLSRWLAKPVAPSPPAGPAAVIDRHNHLIVTVPGNTEERHNHVVAALSDAKREGIRPPEDGNWERTRRSKLSDVELLHDETGCPFWQGALIMPWREASPNELAGPRHYARAALRALGYDPWGDVHWREEYPGGYDGKLIKDEGGMWEVPSQWQVGDRVIAPNGRHGTVVEPCKKTLGGTGCEVRYDLEGQQKNDRRHQAKIEADKLVAEPDPPPRVYTLKRLHKQHLSPRARRLVEEQLAALGLLRPYKPPLIEDSPGRVPSASELEVFRGLFAGGMDPFPGSPDMSDAELLAAVQQRIITGNPGSRQIGNYFPGKGNVQMKVGRRPAEEPVVIFEPDKPAERIECSGADLAALVRRELPLALQERAQMHAKFEADGQAFVEKQKATNAAPLPPSPPAAAPAATPGDFTAKLKAILDEQAAPVLAPLMLGFNLPWIEGGCYILADALQRHLGTQAKALGMRLRGASGAVQPHAVVAIDGLYIDGLGVHTPKELSRIWPDYEVDGPLRYPYETGGSGPHFSREVHEAAVQRLLPMLRAGLDTTLPTAAAAPPATAAPLTRVPEPVLFPWRGGSLPAQRLTFDTEATARAHHGAVGGAVGRKNDTYYWTDEPRYFLMSGIAPLLGDPPLVDDASPKTVTAPKATLYGLNTLGEVIAIEVKDLEYSAGGSLTFHLPNKRKRRRWANADGFAVVLRGFGHPDFRGQGGARLRPQAFGVELARFLAQYPAEVLVDLRRPRDKPPAEAMPAGTPPPRRMHHGEIAARLANDPAYKNAMANTPHNARIAMDAALVRVMLDLFRAGYKEDYRQYSDDPAYKKALGDEMFAATFKPAPAPKESEWAPRIATMIMQALDISQGELPPERVRAYQERDRKSGITKDDWNAAIRLLLNQRKISVFTDGTIRLPEADAEEMERLRHRAATLGSEFSYDGDDAPKPKPPAPPHPAPPPAPPGDEAAQVDRLRMMLGQDLAEKIKGKDWFPLRGRQAQDRAEKIMSDAGWGQPERIDVQDLVMPARNGPTLLWRHRDGVDLSPELLEQGRALAKQLRDQGVFATVQTVDEWVEIAVKLKDE